MKRALLFAVVIPVLAACTARVIGPKQVLIPDGETVAVTMTSGTTREGELLAVTDTKLIPSPFTRGIPRGLSDEQRHRLLDEAGQQDFDHPVTN